MGDNLGLDCGWANDIGFFLEERDEPPSSDDDQVYRAIIRDERPPSPPLRNASQSEMAVEIINSLWRKKNLLIECPTLMNRKSTILRQILRFWQWRKGNRSFHLTEAKNLNLETSPNPQKIFVVTRNIIEARELGEELRDLEYSELLRGITVAVLDPQNDLHVQDNAVPDQDDQPNDGTNGRKRSSNGCQNQPTSSKKPRLEMTSSKNGDSTKNQQLVANADLIICSAEYILSSFRRAKFGLKIDNAIVFLDDGADLENMCKDEGTIKITAEQLDNCCQILRSITDDRELNDEDGICLTELSSSLEELLQWINAEVDSEPSREEILDEIITLTAGLNYTELIRILTQPEVLSNADLNANKEDILEKLQKFVAVLELVSGGKNGFQVQIEKIRQESVKKEVIVLELWLADPSIVLEPISSSAISVIVGANCVAPYSPFYTEFPGIFTKEQTLIILHDEALRDRHLIVYATKGHHGGEFDLKFRNRRKPCVRKEVFASLPAICREIPDGVVVLFHSDEYYKQLLAGQSGTDLKAALRQSGKQVFWESVGSEIENEAVIENWRSAASKGAVLLALSRGKLLRNQQFCFQHCRGVVHVSIPFGAWNSDDVILAKRGFLDRKYDDTNSVQNKDWYNREAFRVLNQSFNYSIKDKNDWGVTIILDIRMHEKEDDFGDMLPGWVRQPRAGVMHYQEFSSLISRVRDKVQEFTTGED